MPKTDRILNKSPISVRIVRSAKYISFDDGNTLIKTPLKCPYSERGVLYFRRCRKTPFKTASKSTYSEKQFVRDKYIIGRRKKHPIKTTSKSPYSER